MLPALPIPLGLSFSPQKGSKKCCHSACLAVLSRRSVTEAEALVAFGAPLGRQTLAKAGISFP